MTVLHLVRHGRAAAGWDTDLDPPLDDLGRRQATEAAALLTGIGPLPVVSSPMRRCRETASPLAERWAASVEIEEGVGEIPSPEGVEMAERVEWLRAAMVGTWRDLGGKYVDFRDEVVRTVCRLASRYPQGCVVFSHFVAINAVIGAATDDDRLVIRSLDNASITVVRIEGESLWLEEGGREADTLIR